MNILLGLLFICTDGFIQLLKTMCCISSVFELNYQLSSKSCRHCNKTVIILSTCVASCYIFFTSHPVSLCVYVVFMAQCGPRDTHCRTNCHRGRLDTFVHYDSITTVQETVIKLYRCVAEIKMKLKMDGLTHDH